MLKTFETIYNYSHEPVQHIGGLRYNIGLISYDGSEGCNRKVVRIWTGLPFEILMILQARSCVIPVGASA